MDSRTSNTALWRTAAAFCHPVTIVAVAIMLLNDHLFKAWWPGSWATGKLSDAAWVTFAPLFIALPLSFLLSRWPKRRDSLVLWFSLAVTAVSYFLFNSWDPFHGLVNGFFSHIAGWGPVARDPTDSITLIALALTWWIWWRPLNAAALRSRALVVGTAAVLATMATSPLRWDTGISYLEQDGARLLAMSPGQNQDLALAAYTSLDGGMTWSALKGDNRNRLKPGSLDTRVIGSGAVRYRFAVGVAVERSDDGGATWREDYDLRKISAPSRRVYYEKRIPQRTSALTKALPVPLDAVMDTTSGNLVLAMGQDGVLVRTPNGQWSWVSVGNYKLEQIGAWQLLTLVNTEFLLGAIFALLSLATILRRMKSEGKASLALLVLSWAWFAYLILSLAGGKLENSTLNVDAVNVILSLPLIVTALIAIGLTGPIFYGRIALLWRILAALAAEYILFTAPLILWSQGLISEYGSALFLAVILGLACLGISTAYLSRYEQRTRPIGQEDN